ncbi:myo-inositol-1(or 4)-monophosphatase [Brachybacterium muris]|uniref:inositol monophosphatase family protein n=1 Tax=Brachybacterium muris TaxID=219301 RepID=UPI00195D2C43|nr:inositol monophosphatase [Brachybacterium muris]MBM7500331.1 myo-inositol-1(or 4)-monophosphatase [Brachybacterium muris]MCT1430174.1 inositol monophosphatase [Brachybacterium muris]
MNTSAPSAPAPVPTPSELLEIAVGAAALAADHIRSLDRDSLAREYKTSSKDIVTEHDRACEEMIVAELRRRLPTCRIVGEEGGERPAEGTSSTADAPAGATRSPSHEGPVVSFFVDPIDGTSNFAAGLPLFCVSIGVAMDDELVAGVIDAPVLGTVFTAADGPAMINGVPITPRPTKPAKDAMVLSGFLGPRISGQFPEYAARAGNEINAAYSAVRSLGTAALELAYVAAGWADATAFATLNAWDVAAGFHIVKQAGGSLRTWPGTAVAADAPAHLQPACVACAGPERLELLDRLQDELQQLRDAQK